jgi:hypothetical protein
VLPERLGGGVGELGGGGVAASGAQAREAGLKKKT